MGFEQRIRELLAAYPTMPATLIAERIGWPLFHPYAERSGGAAAAVVSATGSGGADQLCAG